MVRETWASPGRSRRPDSSVRVLAGRAVSALCSESPAAKSRNYFGERIGLALISRKRGGGPFRPARIAR